MNLLTEKQALTKWCPFTRIVQGDVKKGREVIVSIHQASFNRVATAEGQFTIPDASACCASKCMQWLWADDALGQCGLRGKING